VTRDQARSLGHRIRNLAEERGVEAARLRRHLTFQRLLARLAGSGNWVLKGGFCLEARLGTAARATRDLDVALRAGEPVASTLDLQDLLSAEASGDPAGDGFRFEIGLPAPISADEQGNPGWRATVRAAVEGAHFEWIKLDVVARPEEIAGGVETLVLEPVLHGIAGHDAVTIAAVDVHQHAAEKIHAYARIYAHDRVSSRVKDLVDLVLLVEAGLLMPHPLRARLCQVFAVRDASSPPADLPQPPATWAIPYAAMAAELGLAATDSQAGWAAVTDEYHRTLTEIDGVNVR
jgi:Nucleotidyl transferase AbiEii toxin, Type IV TA system